MKLLACTSLAALAGAAGALPPLPRLNIELPVTVSGISSGADFAAQFHVANSDIVNASGMFAGQAPNCAVVRFDTEEQYMCASQPASSQGPGCVGLNTTGPALCIGCDPNMTITYDHCKKPPNIALVEIDKLVAVSAAAAAAGQIPPLSNLKGQRAYMYRGTRDSVYQEGSVNKTQDFFNALGVETFFEASIPSGHSQPSIDPAVSPKTCGGGSVPGSPGGMQNCGYDGPGATLQWAYRNSLAPPPPNATFNDTEHMLQFDQTLYSTPIWGGFASFGYAYIPQPCAEGQPCRLHVAFHGCGQSATSSNEGTGYVYHGGYNQWAIMNNMVILYPQGGGFAERNITAPTAQIQAGCFDGYGQTGPLFSSTGGPQMQAVRNMIAAIVG